MIFSMCNTAPWQGQRQKKSDEVRVSYVIVFRESGSCDSDNNDKDDSEGNDRQGNAVLHAVSMHILQSAFGDYIWSKSQ